MATIADGYVYDENMQPIPDVNISLVNEKKYTRTNANGFFSIQSNLPNDTIKFSHAAYDYDSMPVSDYKKVGFIKLYGYSLDEVVIKYPKKQPESSNIGLWLLLLGAIGFIATRKKKQQPKKVVL